MYCHFIKIKSLLRAKDRILQAQLIFVNFAYLKHISNNENKGGT